MLFVLCCLGLDEKDKGIFVNEVKTIEVITTKKKSFPQLLITTSTSKNKNKRGGHHARFHTIGLLFITTLLPCDSNIEKPCLEREEPITPRKLSLVTQLY